MGDKGEEALPNSDIPTWVWYIQLFHYSLSFSTKFSLNALDLIMVPLQNPAEYVVSNMYPNKRSTGQPKLDLGTSFQWGHKPIEMGRIIPTADKGMEGSKVDHCLQAVIR